MRLRPYKNCDAQHILSWSKDADAFMKWSGGRFGDFPITPEIFNEKYNGNNGDCIENDNFYPMTAFDDSGIIGHLIMRYLHGDNRILRFGWVIVDDTKRGNGCGKSMLLLALKYAFEILKVDKVTLGVFDNNQPAYHCYKAAGFRDITMDDEVFAEINGEKWKIIEMEITKEEYML